MNLHLLDPTPWGLFPDSLVEPSAGRGFQLGRCSVKPHCHRSHFSSPILRTPFILAQMELASPATWDKVISWPLAWVSRSISSITPPAWETLLFILKPQFFPRSLLNPREVGGECSCPDAVAGNRRQELPESGVGSPGALGPALIAPAAPDPRGLSPV